MVEAQKDMDEKGPAVDAEALSRLADASAKLLAGQAAAMTVMTAYSVNLTNHMAGLFLNAFNAGQEARGGQPEDVAPAAQAGEPEVPAHDNVVPLRTRKSARAPKKDDLKRISGIGPKLEKVLHARGITRFSQIAQLDAGELSALDAELGLEGRAVRDDWVGQARAISGEQH